MEVPKLPGKGGNHGRADKQTPEGERCPRGELASAGRRGWRQPVSRSCHMSYLARQTGERITAQRELWGSAEGTKKKRKKQR